MNFLFRVCMCIPTCLVVSIYLAEWCTTSLVSVWVFGKMVHPQREWFEYFSKMEGHGNTNCFWWHSFPKLWIPIRYHCDWQYWFWCREVGKGTKTLMQISAQLKLVWIISVHADPSLKQPKTCLCVFLLVFFRFYKQSMTNRIRVCSPRIPPYQSVFRTRICTYRTVSVRVQ